MQLINDMNFLMCGAFTSICTWLRNSPISKIAASGRWELRRRKAAVGAFGGEELILRRSPEQAHRPAGLRETSSYSRFGDTEATRATAYWFRVF